MDKFKYQYFVHITTPTTNLPIKNIMCNKSFYDSKMALKYFYYVIKFIIATVYIHGYDYSNKYK